MILARVSRETMAANHAAARVRRQPERETVTLNVKPVLDLGSIVYVPFRGRAFGVPPVAWRRGERLLALRMEAMKAAGDGTLTAESSGPYFRAIGEMATEIWKGTRPLGKFRRVLKSLGLLRNPFQAATEAEVVALADFFLQRRMASSVGTPKTTPHRSMTA